MNPLILSLPGNESLAEILVDGLPADRCDQSSRQFPDGEAYIRIDSPVAGRDVILVATLNDPNEKLMLLYLFASTLRFLGARRIVLVAPYLPYMRQDRAFHAGEAPLAAYVARYISKIFDALITVDPHLHRVRNLQDLYSIPTDVVHASQAISHWVDENVARPMIVGPDMESRQWSEEVARAIDCPSIVLHKVRNGDRSVEVSIPDLPAEVDRTPVILDDIVSTGQTLISAVHKLRNAGFPNPVCLGIHAMFDQETIDQLRTAGAERIVSCNTIQHPSNAIDVHRSIMVATRSMLKKLSIPRTTN